MRAMQAAAFVGYDNLELVDVQKPVATDSKLLVRNTAAGVTHSTTLCTFIIKICPVNGRFPDGENSRSSL